MARNVHCSTGPLSFLSYLFKVSISKNVVYMYIYYSVAEGIVPIWSKSVQKYLR